MKNTGELTTRKMEFQRVGGNGNTKRVQRRRLYRREKDSAEIKAYLNKLQDIVPLMPKNRRLRKVEVISYVIEYIRDLRQTLGMNPSCVSDGDDDDFEMLSPDSTMLAALSGMGTTQTALATLTVINSSNNNPVTSSLIPSSPESISPSHPSQTRQPLVVIANTTQQAS